MGLIIAAAAQDRLLAETLAHCLSGAAVGAGHRRALAAAEAQRGVEDKLIAYHRAMPEAAPARRSLTRQLRLLRVVVAALMLVALLAGAATAATALGPGGGAPVNIFHLLASLLGLHLLLLLLWLAVIAFAPEQPAGRSLGAGAIWLWRRLSRMAAKEELPTAAAGALTHRLMAPPAGRWTASVLTHGLWLGYLGGALAMTLVGLSTEHIVFIWETTILGAEEFAAAIGALGVVPAALGFPAPDAAEIAAARLQGGTTLQAQDPRPWSGLLVGCLVGYGLLPRTLALLACLGLARRALARPLDLADPAFARMIPALAPVMRRSEILDRDTDTAGDRPPASAHPAGMASSDPPPPTGPVAVLGWEIAMPACGWPPPGGGADVIDLGLCESREDLATAAGRARSAGAERLLAVADLTVTPDRGVQAGLAEMAAAAGADRLFLVLTREGALRRRLSEDESRERIADWVAAAHAAGLRLEHVLAVDLDALGPHERRRFARMTGASGGH